MATVKEFHFEEKILLSGFMIDDVYIKHSGQIIA